MKQLKDYNVNMNTTPPIWRERKMIEEIAKVLRSDYYHHPPQVGNGQTVLLLPGLWAGDSSLSFLASFLKKAGFKPRKSGISVNIDCSEKTLAQLEKRLLEISQDSPVWIIGQSRGGTFAKVLAIRHPDKVKGIITLGSPLIDPLENIHPHLHLHLAFLSTLGHWGMPKVCKPSCVDQQTMDKMMSVHHGGKIHNGIKNQLEKQLRRALGKTSNSCCENFWLDILKPLPAGIQFHSVYSLEDGIVDWHACQDLQAQLHEVHSTHCGMAASTEVFEEIINCLKTKDKKPSGKAKSKTTSSKASPKPKKSS